MLNNKQKQFLRGLGNTTKAIFQIGKDGLSEKLILSLKDALLAHELVKLSVLKSCATPVMEIALDLSSQTHSEVVQIIGHTVILYKASEKKRIQLP